MLVFDYNILRESGIDIINEKNNENDVYVTAKVADMTDLPFTDEEFDCAIYLHTIYYTNFNGGLKTIAESKRVLKT